MGLPPAFLLGLLLLWLDESQYRTLPGSGSLPGLIACLPLLALPRLICVRLAVWARKLASKGAVPGRRALRGLWLLPLVVPLAYWPFLELAHVRDLAAHWFASWPGLQILIVTLPLLLLDYSLRMDLRAAQWLYYHGAMRIPTLGIHRLPVGFVIVVPLAVIQLLQDGLLGALGLTGIEVTTIWTLTATLLLCLGFALAMPWFALSVLKTSKQLPDVHAPNVHAMVQKAGMPAHRVRTWHTGHRQMNAAVVGLIPHLLMSDALLSRLSPSSVGGVVAHELGHARARHLHWNMLLLSTPLLLLPVATCLGGLESWPMAAGVTASLVLGALLLVFCAVARRFEYEADEFSARTIGDVAPCISALLVTSGGSVNRSSLRHPSVRSRVAQLEKFVLDPAHQDRFTRRGIWYRAAILACVLAAGFVGMMSLVQLWPMERAQWLFRAGEFTAARSRLDTLRTGGRYTEEDLSALTQALDIITALNTPDRAWSDVGERAWQVGLRTLQQEGATKALPYMALVSEDADDVRQSTKLFCDAVHHGHTDDAFRIRAHILRLAPDAEVLRALAAWDGQRG